MNGEVVLGRRSARAGQIYTRQRTMPSRSQRVHGGSLRTRRRPGAMAQRSHKAWMHGRDNIFLSASFLANKLGPKIRTPAPHLRRNCSREASYDRHSCGSGGVRRRTASCVCTNVASRSFARGHNGHGERRCATLRDESMTPHEIVGTTAGEASEKVCSSAMFCVCGRTDKAPGDGGVFGSVAAAEWAPPCPPPLSKRAWTIRTDHSQKGRRNEDGGIGMQRPRRWFRRPTARMPAPARARTQNR